MPGVPHRDVPNFPWIHCSTSAIFALAHQVNAFHKQLPEQIIHLSGQGWNPGSHGTFQPGILQGTSAHLSGQLREEVLIHGQGAQVVQVPDGGGQGLQLVAAAVKLLQQGQAAMGNP